MKSELFPDHSQRYHRLFAALRPDYIKVDERSEAELIAFAVEYAALLIFHEQNDPDPDNDQSTGQSTGQNNWTGLFKGDVTFLLATMCTVDSRREFYASIAPRRLQSRHPGVSESDGLRDQILSAALRINSWYEQALDTNHYSDEGGVEISLRATLATIIAERLARLLLKDDELRIRWQQQQVHSIWDVPPDTKFVGHGPPDQDVRDIYNEFNRATAQLASVAREYLTQSLQEKDDHPAHGALYLAFVSLLVQSQVHINTLTERHLDFYYRKVLRLNPRVGTSDTAHVNFQLAPNLDEYALKKGTLLIAGKDANGEDIRYSVDEGVLVNRAALVSVKALTLPRDADVDKTILGREPVAGVFAFPVANSADGRGKPLEHPEQGWPTFGRTAPRYTVGGMRSARDTPGILISSPILNLTQGNRRLRITFRFADGSMSLERALHAYERSIQSKYEGELPPTTFARMLSEAFRVSYSTVAGFHEVGDVLIERDDGDPNAIVLTLALDPKQPPVVPNRESAGKMGIRDTWPYLKIAPNPRARVFAYSFLTDLVIERITIRADVRGLSTLFLHNGLGPVDAGKAFAPFGPLPAKGSQLVLASDELREKALDGLRLNIEWANLPEAPDDLGSHYAAYGRDTANDSFRATFSVLTNSSWMTLNPGRRPPRVDRDSTFPLFTDDAAASGGLEPRGCWEFALDGVRFPGREPRNAPIRLDRNASDGFFRLELVDPAYGFGSELYPQRLVDVAAANALLKKVKARKPLPKPPFVPEIKSLSIDYTASVQIFPAPGENASRDTGDAGIVYHTHPFDRVTDKNRGDAIVPVYGEQGYLFLGLSNVVPSRMLTLLFHMHESTADKWIDAQNPKGADVNESIRWRYLAEDQWRDFERDDLIADGTLGFTRSGIVKLRIPRDITRANTLMEAGLYWLQIGAVRSVSHYGRMIGIYTQATTATRVSGHEGGSRSTGIAAGTISGLVEPVAQVQSVNQPFASRNGRTAERTESFRIRVSERLRHKQRAIHPRDYESLVLEAFPDIKEAKAFGHGAGRVVVVVVPMESGTTPEREPRVPEFALKQIAEYLRRHTSPFVEEICVRNPWYEPLEISAWVKFAGGNSDDSLPVLEQALQRFIAPWHFDQTIPMEIGTGILDLPKLRAFIERQPYVHQLTGLSIVHIYKTEDGELVRHRLRDSSRSRSGYSVFRTSSPWSVLVSARRHQLKVLRDHSGIGDLEISSDFVITSPEDADLLLRSQLRFPRRPAKAGIGNLEIGTDFITTTEQDAVPDA